jgi:hypothetical protein
MMNIEPGGGCALYVTLTAMTPSQRVATSMAAVIGTVVVVVGGGVVVVSVVVVVVVEVHDDSFCCPDTDPSTGPPFKPITALTTHA